MTPKFKIRMACLLAILPLAFAPPARAATSNAVTSAVARMKARTDSAELSASSSSSSASFWESSPDAGPPTDLIVTNSFLDNPDLVWFALRSIAAQEHYYTNLYGVAGAQKFNHWDEDRLLLTNIFPSGFPAATNTYDSTNIGADWRQNGFSDLNGVLTLTNCDGAEYHHYKTPPFDNGMYDVQRKQCTDVIGDAIPGTDCEGIGYPRCYYGNKAPGGVGGQDMTLDYKFPDVCSLHPQDYKSFTYYYFGTFDDGTSYSSGVQWFYTPVNYCGAQVHLRIDAQGFPTHRSAKITVSPLIYYRPDHPDKVPPPAPPGYPPPYTGGQDNPKWPGTTIQPPGGTPQFLNVSVDGPPSTTVVIQQSSALTGSFSSFTNFVTDESGYGELTVPLDTNAPAAYFKSSFTNSP